MRLGKSPGPLLRVRVNISAQWLIGRFVRVLHSKSGLINCAGWEDELFLSWSSSYTKTQKNAKLPPYDIIKAKNFYVRLLARP